MIIYSSVMTGIREMKYVNRDKKMMHYQKTPLECVQVAKFAYERVHSVEEHLLFMRNPDRILLDEVDTFVISAYILPAIVFAATCNFVCVCVCRHWHGDAFFSFLNDTSAKHNTQCTDISAKFKSKTRRQCIKRATLVKTMTVKSSSETIQSILQNGANQIELDFYVGMRRIE